MESRNGEGEFVMRLGSGEFIYECDESWAREAKERLHIGVVAGVSVDAEDNVYVLARSNPPAIVLNRKGEVLETFGAGLFGRAHGMFRDRDGSLFGVDDARHAVFKFNAKREVVMTLGTPDRASDTGYGEDHKTVERAAGPFNRPTRLVTDDRGNIYVTDGYGNARVHKFDAQGRLLLSWGEPGAGPGQFNLPHGIGISPDNRTLYVADRQNFRVQLFTTEGEPLASWGDFHRPSDIWVDRSGLIYVSENKRCSGFGPAPSRVSIVAPGGEILARLGGGAEEYSEASGFFSAHGVAVDSEGSIYVGNVGQNWPKGASGLFRYVRV